MRPVPVHQGRRDDVNPDIGQSEETFRALVRCASDLLLVAEADGAIRFASDALQMLLGRAPEELIGTSGHTFLHPDDRDAVRASLAGVARGEITKRVEARVAHRDGSWRVLEFLGANHLDDPAIRAIVISARDITEHRRAQVRLERQYREAEAARYRTQAILNATDEAMILISPEGLVLALNRRFENFFAVKEANLVDMHVHEISEQIARAFGAAGSTAPLELFAADQGLSSIRELRQTWPRERDLQLSSSPVRTPEGAFLGRLFVFRDVTLQREAEHRQDEFVSFGTRSRPLLG
jgi:PAS domain S-box-containing protein